jgi:hypothetical protein
VEAIGLVEEPISPELALVDRELALRARDASSSRPWLLPVLAEFQQAEEAGPAPALEERSAAAVRQRPRRSSFTSHVRAGAVFGCLLIALVALGSLVFEFLPASGEPTVVTKPVGHAATSEPTQSPAGGRTRQVAKHPTPRRAVKPKAIAKTKPAPARIPTRAAVTTPAPKRAAKPLAPRKVQRVFSWHRYAAAVYYQFYFRRGGRTIYEARTARLTAALPAHLKLRPGTYHALVRPAIPSDAGIILGPVIVEKTMRV